MAHPLRAQGVAGAGTDPGPSDRQLQRFLSSRVGASQFLRSERKDQLLSVISRTVCKQIGLSRVCATL